MDTSETYIKMCDCPEIQEIRENKDSWVDGDYSAIRVHDWVDISEDTSKRMWVNRIEVYHSTGYFIFEYPKGYPYGKRLFLPRQDQIQEMLRSDIEHIWTGLVEFAGNLRDEYEWLNPIYRDFSWEQLWLAFYMKEKHNKLWNGENWIVSN